MFSVRDQFVARIHLGNHHKYKKDPYEEIRYMKDYFVYGVDKEVVSIFFFQRYCLKVHHYTNSLIYDRQSCNFSEIRRVVRQQQQQQKILRKEKEKEKNV